MFTADSTRKFFTALSSSSGVKVEYKLGLKKPIALRSGRVMLPPPTIDNEDDWAGMAHKEASYLYPENKYLFTATEGLDPDSTSSPEEAQQIATQKAVGQILSDHIAERSRYGEYSGRDNALTHNRANITQDVAERLQDAGPLDDQGQLISDLLRWDAENRKKWMEYKMKLTPEIPKGKYSEKLEDLDSRVKEVKDEESLNELMDHILNLLEDQSEGEDDGKGKQSDKSNGNGGDADNSDSDGGKDDSEGQGDQSDSPGNQSDSPGDESDSSRDQGDPNRDQGKQGSVQSEDGGDGDSLSRAKTDESEEGEDTQIEESNAVPTLDGEASPGNTNVSNHIGSGLSEQAKPLDLTSVMEGFKDTNRATNEKFNKEYNDPWEDNNGVPSSYSWQKPLSTEYIPLAKQQLIKGILLDSRVREGRYNEAMRQAAQSVISKQVRKYLQALSSDNWSYGKKRGKLCNRSISRCYSGVRDPRIFKERQATKVRLDTAISLLIDCSGSMNGNRYIIGTACCICLHECLSGLGIPHEILGFTDSGSLITYEFKTFAENITPHKLCSRMSSSHLSMNYNADGESVMLAAERLLTRPEKNKVMFVLSDGQPAGHYIGDGSDYLRRVTNIIEEKTPINLHGIGIQSSKVKDYYKSNRVVNRLEDLDDALMGLLKSSVLK